MKEFYDMAGQKVKTVADVGEANEMNAVTNYTYDLAGNLWEVEDPKGQSTRYTYGVGGRLLGIELPGSEMADHLFSYDARGNRVSANLGRGAITYAYDEWDRITRVDYPDATHDEYTYEVYEDQFTTLDIRTATRHENNQPVNKVRTEYDPLGRLVLERIEYHDDTKRMKYSYDGASRLIEAVYPDNTSVSYQYDQAGRLIKVPDYAENLGGAGFVYSRNGFLKEMHLKNGAKTTYTTSAAARNRPTQIETKINGNPIFNQTYDWDYEGNVIQINGQVQQYDALQRLTTAVTPTESVGPGTHEVTYTYDLAGNRMTEKHGGVTRAYTYVPGSYGNAIKEVATTGEPVEVFGYHASGTIETRTKGGLITNYSYDRANRLTKVEVGGQTVAEYTYDAHGRLIETVEHLPGAGTRTTRRIPAGTETIYEEVKEGTDTWATNYIRANGRYLARGEKFNNGTPQTYFYHSDHLGSTRTVSGGSGVDSELAYDAYGNVINTGGNSDSHTHRFTGKPQDNTGLYYYGARFYDPTIGRFISLDQAKDGLNWYAYTYNNPLKYVDPTGMFTADYDEGYDWPTGGVVEEGDTLSSIALEYYGDASAAIYLAELNDISDHDSIFVGQYIFLPGAMSVGGEEYYQLAFYDGGVLETSDVFWAVVGGRLAIRLIGAGYAGIASRGLKPGPLNPNTLHHVFGKPKHKLEGLLGAYGGNQVKAYKAIEKAIRSHLSARGITGRYEETVRVGTFNVTVRGNVIDGVVRIGTAFVKSSP